MKILDPCQASQIGSLLACEIAKGKSIEEINLLKNIASQVSSSLQVIISQTIINETINKSQKDF